MSHRATFTLNDEAYAFLMAAGKENKSAFVNRLLIDEKRKALEAALARANREEATDDGYQEELAVWDETLPDGL